MRTTCTWQGQPFIVLGEHDAWLRVEYTGGRWPVAAGAAGWRCSTSASTRAGRRPHEVTDLRRAAGLTGQALFAQRRISPSTRSGASRCGKWPTPSSSRHSYGRDHVAAGTLRGARQRGGVQRAVQLQGRGDQRLLHQLDEPVAVQPQQRPERPAVPLQRAERRLRDLHRLPAPRGVVGEVRRGHPRADRPSGAYLADRPPRRPGSARARSGAAGTSAPGWRRRTARAGRRRWRRAAAAGAAAPSTTSRRTSVGWNAAAVQADHAAGAGADDRRGTFAERADQPGDVGGEGVAVVPAGGLSLAP